MDADSTDTEPAAEELSPMLAELAELAGRVGDPDPVVTSRTRLRFGESGLTRSAGQLADLALWWAGVRGDDRAPAPEEVLTLRLAATTVPTSGAFGWGRALVERAVDAGTDLVLLSAQDDAAARLVAAAVLQLDPVEAAGWPMARRVADEAWMGEVLALRDGLSRLRRRTDGMGPVGADVLVEAMAGPVLGAAAAVALTGAARRTPVLLDGAGAVAAALLARRASYPANQWWRLAHPGAGAPFDKAVESLSLVPVLDFGLTLQDGIGARLALAVLTEAAGLLGR